MEKEIWKDVVGYEGLYQVSNLGRVKSLDRLVKGKCGNQRIAKGRILKFCNLKDGYLGVGLHNCGKCATKSVHRIVMEAFIDNSENKSTVNHIDGNKQNNRLENLEWNTYKENNCHAYKTGLNKPHGCKKVNQYDLNGKFIKQWNSMTEVNKELGVSISDISECCNKKQNSARGYMWDFGNNKNSNIKKYEKIVNGRKLTRADANNIRIRFADNKKKNSVILMSKEYGVSKTTIKSIIRGKTYNE